MLLSVLTLPFGAVVTHAQTETAQEQTDTASSLQGQINQLLQIIQLLQQIDALKAQIAQIQGAQAQAVVTSSGSTAVSLGAAQDQIDLDTARCNSAKDELASAQQARRDNENTHTSILANLATLTPGPQYNININYTAKQIADLKTQAESDYQAKIPTINLNLTEATENINAYCK